MNPKLDFGSGKSKAEDEEEEDAEEEKRRKLQVDSHVCVFPYEIADRLFARPLTTQAQVRFSELACCVPFRTGNVVAYKVIMKLAVVRTKVAQMEKGRRWFIYI